MIVFDLECRAGGHRFEAWFASNAAFAAQAERGLVDCPNCGSLDVVKAPMAPRLSRKGNQLAPIPAPAADKANVMTAPSLPREALAMMHALAAVQTEAIKTSQWVGEKFADETRAIHYGEREATTIHGQATREEADDLLEEGILVVPLLIPFAPPDEVN